ncbi:hypothetical protein D1007_14916 [Hordeum vulgare]|nr:hypothetical protein D1007_14916 [Hordeum vulgare]
MVSWNDNDSSDDFAAEYISHADHLSRLVMSRIPGTIEDPNYAGVDDDLMMMCEHGKSVEKLAAFEGISTGRRFLACSLDCGQPPSLAAKDAEITKLKADVDQLKFIHVAQGNCIRNMKHNHLKENENMSTDNRTLKFCWADLKKEKEKLDGCIAELMKDKEKWSIEKSAIECCIANLKKACENNNMKLKKIKCICDEE